MQVAKARFMSGIYRIRGPKGKVYIGGTTQDFSRRWDQHCSDLVDGSHSNHELQADWNAYGSGAFRFEIVERVADIENVPAVEQKHLDRLFASGMPAYNILEKTTFPRDKEWYEEKKMARKMGFLRGWAQRPGRYERKESNIRTDWLMPILQGLACVTILFLDLLFLGSWIFILPPEIDWVLGLILFWAIWSAALIGNWIFIRLLPFSVPGKWKTRRPGTVDFLLRRPLTWIPCIMIEIGILMFIWVHVWDWWWEQCLKYPDITIPVPSMEGVTGFFILGLFISFIGMVGIVLHPSKYALGLTAFGGFVSTLSHLVSPVSVQVAHERPIIVYAVWAIWCVAWVVGTLTLGFRFFFKELPDPYIPEITDRTPIPGAFGGGPASAEGQTRGIDSHQ